MSKTFQYRDGYGQLRTSKFAGMSATVYDEATPYLRYLAATFPAEVSSAVRHFAWWSRQQMVQAIKNGGPKTMKWKPLARVKGRWESGEDGPHREMYRGRGRKFYGKLSHGNRAALAYYHKKGSMTAEIGWLDKSAARYGYFLQKGNKERVTQKMRRMFNRAGFKVGKYIRRPARPLIDPIEREIRSQMEPRIEARMLAYLKGARGKAATRMMERYL